MGRQERRTPSRRKPRGYLSISGRLRPSLTLTGRSGFAFLKGPVFAKWNVSDEPLSLT